MKNVLIFLAGVAAGAVASYFVTKNKCESANEAQMNDIQQVYNDRLEAIEQKYSKVREMDRKKAEMMEELEKKVENEKLEAITGEYTNYSAMSKSPKKKDEPKNPIRFITDVEAQKLSKDYEFTCLSLYDDNVVIDEETENIIEDYVPWIGEDGIEGIRRAYSDGESVYILNENRKAIYDITVIDERFGDDYEPVTIE